MKEKTKTKPQAATEGPVATEQPQLRFSGVDVIMVNYEAQRPTAGAEGVNLVYTITPEVVITDSTETGLFQFSLFMHVEVTAEGFFSLKADMVSVFFCDANLEEDKRKRFINNSAPSIMFPYVRAFISTFTANIGLSFSPVILPPQFFDEDLTKGKELTGKAGRKPGKLTASQ